MINQVVEIGRLTRDPELRYTPGSGIAVCNFDIAVERPFKNKQGERETDFFKVVAWRKTAELAAENLGKGRLTGISGRLQQRRYQNNEGQNREIVEIVAEQIQFLDWPKQKNNTGSTQQGHSNSNNEGQGYNPGDEFGGKEYHVEDDQIPF